MDNIRIIIERNISNLTVDIFMVENRGSERIITGFNGKDLVPQKVTPSELPSERIIPLLTLPAHLFDLFLKQMVEQADSRGIRPDSNAILEGELKATKEHLLDMKKAFNKLINLPLENITNEKED